jgi:hypothetical protein
MGQATTSPRSTSEHRNPHLFNEHRPTLRFWGAWSPAKNHMHLPVGLLPKTDPRPRLLQWGRERMLAEMFTGNY